MQGSTQSEKICPLQIFSAHFPPIEITDAASWLTVTGSPVSFEETGAADGGHTESAFTPEARLEARADRGAHWDGLVLI